MKTVIVLAMHGMPPRDFPKAEMAEYFSQYNPFHHGAGGHSQAHSRFHEIEEKMRHWPRSPKNDAFYGAAFALAEQLKTASGNDVIVGFNEFCAPGLDEAYDQAAEKGAERIIVVTPMMTPGGIHSELDIPQSIASAKTRHPATEFQYIWPFPVSAVAAFLNNQIDQFVPPKANKLPAS